MKKRSNALKFAAASCVSTLVLLAPLAANAAPGTLSDTPMFLSNPVEPNILFMVDDSGSMDWGTMTPENSGLMNLGCEYYYVQPAADNDYTWMVPTEAGLIAQGVAAPYAGVWRGWSSDYNKVYYDPTQTYTPWPGEDAAGNLYTNVNAAAAPLNPYVTGSPTVDLTAVTTYNTDFCGGGLGGFTVNNFLPARYQQWTDTDLNGQVDDTDAHTLVEITPLTLVYTGGPSRRDCGAAPFCNYAEEIRNFANWFSYYRKREYVAKAAYGQVIAGASSSRMGLVTLHNNAAVNTAIASMNLDPGSGAKETLLDSLYEFQAAGGTPLRAALDNGGKYLGCQTNGFFGSCPALPIASGAECQQNFTVLMTDGFYNGAFTGPGNADGDNNSPPWDSGPTGPYGDTSSDTLADIAMEYYEDDLRPGTDNNLVPPPGAIDENTAQHMVTYSVAFGVQGNVTAMPANGTDPFAWPAPITNAGLIDDLRHAAWNSRGEFHSAQNPAQLVTGLRNSLRSIQSRIGSAASVAFNTGSLSTNSEVYLALFNSEQWNGDLLAFDLDSITGSINPAPKWSAGTALGSRNLSSNPRTILTYDGADGTAFGWTDLTPAQQLDFRTDSSGTLDNEASGMARHGHMRGDKGCEFSSPATCFYDDGTNVFNVKSLRERNGRLGDIVHSGPVFAGAPESNWPDVAPFPGGTGQTYTEFREANATRQGVVYVGGNDGMLHGFSQTDGEELLAYVPSPLYSANAADGLHYMSDPAYSHRYSVDLRASIADVYARTTTAGSVSWKTVLIGGLRGGGRGLFALDVTNPGAFSESGTNPASTVMWEFTSADDIDLGHTFSRPSIVPLEASGNTIRWGVVVGNGYNDLGSGEAKLFILFIEEGLDGTWSAGDYVEISTEVGNTTNRNGLSTPAVIDTDGDGLADRAYAGDLEGNMWAFDLSGSNAGNWEVAHKQGSTPKPLFVAPANQQITSTPVIVRNNQMPTVSSNFPNTLVMFGTGQYLTTADITTASTQTMYGVYDAGDRERDRSDLVQQSIALGNTPGGAVGRTLTDNAVSYTTDYGWFIDLPDSGERVVTDAVIRGDLVFFNTMRPDTNPCEAGGRGWLMVAKWINGGRPSEVAFDINGDSLLDTDDTINTHAAAGVEIIGIPTSPVNLANKRYTSTTQTTGGSTIQVTDIIKNDGPKTGRLSWEELTQ